MACAVDHLRENQARWRRRGTAFFKSLLPSKKLDGIHEMLVKRNQTTNGRRDSSLPPPQLGFNRISYRINLITPQTYHNLDSFDVTLPLLRRLEQAMDLYESDNVLQARKAQQQVFEGVLSLKHPDVHFKPTKLGWRVMKRGKESFLRNAISSCLLHGTILLDTSDSATQFYASFLNVLGAFAVHTSDFRIASETFKLSIDVFQKSGYTSRSRDLGVAYNNMGCTSTIMGKFKNAEKYLTQSVKHYEGARETSRVPESERIEEHVVAVQNNIARLCMLARDYVTAFRLLAHLVDLCKGAKKRILPLATVLVVIQNQAMLHVTLRNFMLAESELEWLKSFYGESNERNDLLVNYISLHLCDVTFLGGKEAKDIFNLDTLNCAGVRQLLFLNGNMHDNLTLATLERLADVLVHKGKLTVACMVLEEGVQNCKDIFGPTHFHAASLLCKKASVLHLMGDISASIEIYKRALSIWLEIFDFNHPVIMKCHATIADLLAFQGIKDESHLYCERTVEIIETIYQVSFSHQLSVKFSEMMTNQRRTPFLTAKRGSAEDIKIKGLVVEFGVQLALVISSWHPSTKNRKQDWQSPGRRSNGKRLKDPFPPLAISDYLCSQRSISSSNNCLLVIPKFVYDLSQNAQFLARCGMAKESAAFVQTANLFCEKYPGSIGYTELLRTLLCCRSSQTSTKNALFPKGKDFVYKCLNELKDRAKAACQEDVEQSLCAIQLNLKTSITLLMKASIEMNILDATFAAYDLYSSVFPDNGDFIRVCDGLQIYTSRTRIVCNGKNATHDLLIANSVGPTGQDNESCGSDPSLFKTLAYKTGAPTNGFLIIAGANSLMDVEHLEELRLRNLHSVEELFQRTCFENEIQEKSIRFLVELNVSAEGARSSTVSDMDLLALCFSKTFPEARETICEISTEKTCEKLTCMTFSDTQTSSFLFVKSLQYLLQRCPWTEIDTVSIRNEGVVLSFFKPAKARLTVWCEDKNIKQRTQALSTTHRIVGNSCNASTRTFGPCICNYVSGLFLQAVEHCSSMYSVAYQTVVVKQMCTSLSGLGERSLVDDTALQVNTSEPQFRSRRPYLYCEQTLVQEQSRSLRDFLRRSLFHVFDARSTISGMLDKEVPPRSEVSFVNRSDHDSNDVNDLNSLLLQRDVKDATSVTSTPSQLNLETFQASAESSVLVSSLHVGNIEEERRLDNETEYGRWRFEEDQKLRRFQVAECQRELERKRSEKSQILVLAQQGKTIQTKSNKIAELGTRSETLQSGGLPLQKREANGYCESDADSFRKHTNHTFAPEGKNENETSTKESPNADGYKDTATSDERVNGYNETLENHINNQKNVDVWPYSPAIETSGYRKNQQCKETSMDVFPSSPNFDTSGCEDQQCKETSMDVFPSSPDFDTSGCEDQQCNVPSPGCADPFNHELKSYDINVVHGFASEKNEKVMKTECALLKEGFVECKRLPERPGVAHYHDELLSNENERSTEGETGTSMRELRNDRDMAAVDVTRVSTSVEGVGKRNAGESDQGNEDPLAEETNGLFKLQLSKTVDTSDENLIACEETLPKYYCFQNPKIASDVESSVQGNDIIDDGICQGRSDSDTASLLSSENLVSRNDPQWEESQSSSEPINTIIAPRLDRTNCAQAGDDRVGIGEENSTELSLMHRNDSQGGGFGEVATDSMLLASHDVCVAPVQQVEMNAAGGGKDPSTQATRVWYELGNEKRNTTKKTHEKTLALPRTAEDKNSQIGEEKILKVSKQKEIYECYHPKPSSRLPFQGGDVIADSGYEDVSSCCSNTWPMFSENKDVIDGPVQRHEHHSTQKEFGQLSYFGIGKNPHISSKKQTKCNSYSSKPTGIHKAKTVQMKPNCSDARKIRGTRPKMRAQTKMQVPNFSQQYEGIDPGFLARHIASEDACRFNPSMESWNRNSVEYSAVDATGTPDAEHSNVLNCLHEGDYSRRHLDKDFHLATERDLKYIPIMGVNPVIGTSFRGMASHEKSAKLHAANEVIPANGEESWRFPSPPSKECLLRQNDCDDTHHPGIIKTRHISHCEKIAPNSEDMYEDASLHHLGERFSSMIEQSNSLSETLTDSLTSRASNVSRFDSDSDLVRTQDQLSVLGEVISKTVELAALKERLNKDLQRNVKEAALRRNIEQFTEERGIKERAESKIVERGEFNKKDHLQRMETQSLRSPVEESPPYTCGHYQRRCKVQFPCCNKFYPCHRCHNESDYCSEDKAKAVDATHLKCTVCDHKQEIDEGGQWCRGCNLKMADYFCAICKHFTALEKNPFHCQKCGICRIHKDRSFHCEVCNVCLDKRLQGKHKCRPDSGHDECCICLEDGFGGCQILPCSHKVHKDCAVAMVQNGVRTCPVCRHPLSIPLQDGKQ